MNLRWTKTVKKFFLKDFKIYIYLRDRPINIYRAPIHWFTPQIPATAGAGAGPGLRLGTGNLIQVSHMDSRNTVT